MIDYKWDENNDLLIKDGDFVRTDSTLQDQYTVMVANQGSIKFNPEVGVGIDEAINADSLKSTLQKIKRHLVYIGQDVENISLVKGEIRIKAKYPNS